VSFRDALLKGLAPDGGLYMPVNLPVFSREELTELSSLSYPELASWVLAAITGDEIGTEDLSRMCSTIYTFGIPL